MEQSAQSLFDPAVMVSMHCRHEASHSRQRRTHSSMPSIPSQASPHLLQASAHFSQFSMHSCMVTSICMRLTTPRPIRSNRFHPLAGRSLWFLLKVAYET